MVREVRADAVLADVGSDTFPLSPKDLAESRVLIGTRAATLKGIGSQSHQGSLGAGTIRSGTDGADAVAAARL